MERLTFNKLGQWSIVKEEPNLNKALPLYLEYIEPLEKNEKLPHFLRFMGNHPKAEETATWASNLKHRNLAEFAMRHAKTKDEGLNNEEKSTVEHFNNSLHMPEVQRAAGSLNNKHNFETGTALLRGAENQYTERHAKSAPKLVPMEGEKVMDLGNGIAVYNLPLDEYNRNKNEATAMGHCATALKGGQLWSIRKDHGNGMCEPMVTISHVDGYTGEIKGKHNWKPSTDHHVNIAKMMASDLIKGHVGGGYMPESNFNFDDLEPKLREKLLNHKPSLTNSVYREELPKPFQVGYNHEPDMKTLFRKVDFKTLEEQLALLDSRDINIHESLAKDPNTHPKVHQRLLNTYGKKSYIHRLLAQNPNLHPEVADKLLDIHSKNLNNYNHPLQSNDALVMLAQNPNLSPELQHKLFNMYNTGINENLARNLNLHPELQHKLADTQDKNSYVQYLLAVNPNLHLEVQHKLADMYDKHSYVHEKLVQNPNLHPELQHKLFNMYDKDSHIHLHLAENTNLHPEIQHRLADMHDKDSRVHEKLVQNPNLHPEVSKKINKFFNTPIQKLISIVNNKKEKYSEKQKAMSEIRRRRMEKYKQKTSESASLSDLKHMAESTDDNTSASAIKELKRRGVSGYYFKPKDSDYYIE